MPGLLIAPITDQLKKRITITHPFHPLFGQEFPLIQYRRCWKRTPRVEYLNQEGCVECIPLDWTDATDEQDPFLVVSAGRSFFRVEDLLRLAEMIDRWKAGTESIHDI